jgi:hypothetical protein
MNRVEVNCVPLSVVTVKLRARNSLRRGWDVDSRIATEIALPVAFQGHSPRAGRVRSLSFVQNLAESWRGDAQFGGGCTFGVSENTLMHIMVAGPAISAVAGC